MMGGFVETCAFVAPTVVRAAFPRYAVPSSLHSDRRSTCVRKARGKVFATASSKVDTSFEKLVTSLKIRLPSLTLSTFSEPVRNSKESVRGLSATKPISKNETLVSVPSASALQVTTTADESIPAQFSMPKETWRTFPWYARLALMILNVKRDKSHPLHDWVTLLPSYVDTPHHWSDADLAQLQNDHMVALIREQRRSYSNTYNKICIASPTSRMSHDAFIWAVDCVRSRAFSGPLEPAPFRARLRLSLFITVNTFIWPLLNVLPWQNSLNGTFFTLI